MLYRYIPDESCAIVLYFLLAPIPRPQYRNWQHIFMLYRYIPDVSRAIYEVLELMVSGHKSKRQRYGVEYQEMLDKVAGREVTEATIKQKLTQHVQQVFLHPSLFLDLSICWKLSWEVLFINWFLKLTAWNLSDISRSWKTSRAWALELLQRMVLFEEPLLEYMWCLKNWWRNYGLSVRLTLKWLLNLPHKVEWLMPSGILFICGLWTVSKLLLQIFTTLCVSYASSQGCDGFFRKCG